MGTRDSALLLHSGFCPGGGGYAAARCARRYGPARAAAGSSTPHRLHRRRVASSVLPLTPPARVIARPDPRWRDPAGERWRL